jgi:histidine triad (HIT) family protein
VGSLGRGAVASSTGRREAAVFNHAPEGYVCPFCLILGQSWGEELRTRATDVVWRDDEVTAFIASDQWPNNPGHVVVIPNQHFENIYDLPIGAATAIHACVRSVALAMKAAYGCDGTSTRQHNEPAGNQVVWHYHVHVFPRYESDELYLTR